MARSPYRWKPKPCTVCGTIFQPLGARSFQCSLACRLVRYSKPGQGGCRVWTGSRRAGRYGALTVAQYGKLTHRKRGLAAHRVAWVEAHGAIPRGLVVRHKCDNTLCIEVAHLQLGTQAQNVQDAIARNRHVTVKVPTGDNHPNAKLTAKKARLIRHTYVSTDLSQAAIAKRFGISPTIVSRIVRGVLWK